jgi:hypothetical protein
VLTTGGGSGQPICLQICIWVTIWAHEPGQRLQATIIIALIKSRSQKKGNKGEENPMALVFSCEKKSTLPFIAIKI